MNTILTTPDVKLFVAAVREHLADLSEEEREELVGGLEADMGDLVAEQGTEALPEPKAYAHELRAAAGFEAEPEGRRGRRLGSAPLGDRVARLLDEAHDRWVAAVDGLPGRPWELVVALRPAWWVLRAWLALSLVDLVVGGGATGTGLSVVPSLFGVGLPLLAGAVVVSALIGMGRLWPGRGGIRARVVLLALNTLAVAVAPLCFTAYTSAADVESWYGDDHEAVADGLVQDGRPIHNVHAYDAQGQPLVGVQLVDQDGQPLEVALDYFDEAEGVDVELAPWRNGLQDVLNAFPLAERRTDNATGAWTGEPALPEPPADALPPVALDGVAPTRTLTDAVERLVERVREAREAREQDGSNAG